MDPNRTHPLWKLAVVSKSLVKMSNVYSTVCRKVLFRMCQEVHECVRDGAMLFGWRDGRGVDVLGGVLWVTGEERERRGGVGWLVGEGGGGGRYRVPWN